MRGTWQTTSGGGGGAVVAIVAALVIIGAAARAAAAAVPYILAAVGVVVVLGGAALVAFFVSVSRADRRAYTVMAADGDGTPPGITREQPDPVDAAPQHAALPPAEQHLHFHFEDVSAADVAAIIAARSQQEGGPR